MKYLSESRFGINKYSFWIYAIMKKKKKKKKKSVSCKNAIFF